MFINTLSPQQAWAIFLSSALLLTPLSAAPPGSNTPIGSAVSQADFELNQHTVASSGTVLDGSPLSTRRAPSTVRLQGGTRLDLAPDSRGQIFRDHLLLEQGAAALLSSSHYRVLARDFEITPESSSARGSVSLGPNQQLSVSARQGNFRIANKQGVLIARVLPGRSLLFTPAPAPSSDMLLYGLLEKVEGDFFLTDKTSGVRAQIKAAQIKLADLDKQVGKNVCIQGDADSASPRGITVLHASSLNQACSAATAAATGSTTAVSKAAIVAGVAIATGAAVGTTVATSTRSASPSPARGLGPQTISP